MPIPIDDEQLWQPYRGNLTAFVQQNAGPPTPTWKPGQGVFDLVRQTAGLPTPTPQPIRRAEEQARWPWQWGPPYTFPGNPPIAQELSETYNIRPEIMSKMRTVPVSFGQPQAGGLRSTTGSYSPQRGVTLQNPYRPGPALHEYVHAWDWGWGGRNPVSQSLSAPWLRAFPSATQYVPSQYQGPQRLPESLAYAATRHAPFQRSMYPYQPPSMYRPTLSRFFQY